MLRSLWRRHRPATLLFFAAMLVAGFFAARLAFFALYWADPAHREAPIEGWMTPGYIAMTWNVPRPLVIETLGLEGQDGRRMRLVDLAEARGVTVETLAADLKAAIVAHRTKSP